MEKNYSREVRSVDALVFVESETAVATPAKERSRNLVEQAAVKVLGS
jgi:hypothetical protein